MNDYAKAPNAIMSLSCHFKAD